MFWYHTIRLLRRGAAAAAQDSSLLIHYIASQYHPHYGCYFKLQQIEETFGYPTWEMKGDLLANFPITNNRNSRVASQQLNTLHTNNNNVSFTSPEWQRKLVWWEERGGTTGGVGTGSSLQAVQRICGPNEATPNQQDNYIRFSIYWDTPPYIGWVSSQ